MARKARQLRITLLLSVAYSANIGGTGTLIGSTPQLALKGIIEEYLKAFLKINFKRMSN
jgi:sodium-dependent dicarboxylate transporter 2/3/5